MHSTQTVVRATPTAVQVGGGIILMIMITRAPRETLPEKQQVENKTSDDTESPVQAEGKSTGGQTE